MTSRQLLAAIVALAAGASTARAAESAEPAVRARKSVVQRLTVSGPRADPQVGTSETRSLHASFELPTDPTVTVGFTASSPVSLRLGGLTFDATLGDDPRFTPFRRTATLSLPAEPGAPAAASGARVKLRWTGRRISVRVDGHAAALLRDAVFSPGESAISSPAEAEIAVGDGSWLFRGTISGRARVRTETVLGEPRDFARARVTYAGLRADPAADTVPPSVVIATPGDDAVVLGSPARVEGTVSDDRGVSRIFWSVDGGAETETPFFVETTGGGDFDESGSFAFSVPLAEPGARSVRVRVVDTSGNEAADSVAFTYRVLRSSVLATGGDSSFVLRDGAVLAWGSDGSGQLGDGPGGALTSPTVVGALGNPVAIGASDTHTVTLRADGTVWSCGANGFGQLGDGTKVASDVPVEVAGLDDVRSVAAGFTHSIALRADGTVWCWGDNTNGECGDGTMGGDRIAVPVQVTGLPVSVAVAAGYGTSFALGDDGVLRSWGNGRYGATGEWFTSRATPGAVGANSGSGPLGDVVEVSVGSVHAMARKSDGTVWTWGFAAYGALGRGDPYASGSAFQPAPLQVDGVTGATSIAASAYSSAAVLEDGTVLSWGFNGWGEVGDGTRTQRNTPVAVTGLTGVARIASGPVSRHVLALRNDDTLVGWGAYTIGTPLPLSSSDGPWHLSPEVIELP